MFKVSYRYSTGKTGTCIENGEIITFENKAVAESFAYELNNSIDPEFKDFFPIWYVEEV